MPFHLQFKDCLFALQIPICSNVLYTALSPTGEHHQKQIPFSIQPGIFEGLKPDMCVVRGLEAEANGRQEGICPPYLTGLFIHVGSKLTSSAGATDVCIPIWIWNSLQHLIQSLCVFAG